MTEWIQKREVMRHYDFSASVYDTQYAEEQNAKMEAALNGISLNIDSFVLDAGCGTGLLLKHLEKSAKLVVGLDISSRILKKAKERIKQFSKAEVIRADADFLPFQNNVFDATFAITLLQNVPGPLVTLHEMRRVSKDHTPIIITGLRKKFSKKVFVKLLHKARLQVSIMKTNSQINETVATCMKTKEENI